MRARERGTGQGGSLPCRIPAGSLTYPLPRLDPADNDRRIQWLLDHEHAFAEGDGFIITDDYNPLESLHVRKSETYRKQFLERIAFYLLLR